MIRLEPARRLSVVAVIIAIVVGISACGKAEVMRAYNEDGSATSEFVAVVADFMAAVHNSDADHLSHYHPDFDTVATVLAFDGRWAGLRGSM